MIIIGSYNSVKFLIREKISKTDFSGEEAVIESVGMSDAYQFPILGGSLLVFLYVLVKYFGKGVVNSFLICYFVFVGMESFKAILNNYTSFGKIKQDSKENNFKTPILFKNVSIMGMDLSISKFDLVALLCSAVCGVIYVMTNHWTMNNLLGILFTLFALENMFLGDFKVGAVLLGGLFFYDIFFVFGTDVMETVAKSIDGPIKLLFPKNVIVEKSSDLSLLGLGDIIIPGVFIALCLRYDFIRNFDPKTKTRDYDSVLNLFASINKPYFWSCIIGYVIGILVTVAVMLVFKRGQPALLYLVPGCLLSVLLCAFVRKEVQAIYKYNEDEEIKAIYDQTKALAAEKDE